MWVANAAAFFYAREKKSKWWKLINGTGSVIREKKSIYETKFAWFEKKNVECSGRVGENPEVFFMSRYRVQVESSSRANGVLSAVILWSTNGPLYQERENPAGELRMGPVRKISCAGRKSRAPSYCEACICCRDPSPRAPTPNMQPVVRKKKVLFPSSWATQWASEEEML